MDIEIFLQIVDKMSKQREREIEAREKKKKKNEPYERFS